MESSPFPILKSATDNSTLQITNVSGSDKYIAEVARSTIDQVQTRSSDEALIDHLIRNFHTSPIEFGHLDVDVYLPKFSVAQWQRHRTQSYQELSGRYNDMGKIDVWEPIEWRAQGDGPNKQVSDGVLTQAQQDEAWGVYRETIEMAMYGYRRLREIGVCKDQARAVLPFGFMTSMRATANLHNWMGFLWLRLADDAQREIFGLATLLHRALSDHFPLCMAAFDRHRLNGVRFSEDELKLLTLSPVPSGVGWSKGRLAEWEAKQRRVLKAAA